MALSVGDLGRKLLAEVEEVGLSKVSVKERRRSRSSENISNITLETDFDAQLLREYERYSKQEHDVFGALHINHFVNTQSSDQGIPSQPPVIEITSGSPGSGKTHLIYYLTASIILPPSHGGGYSGKGAFVVVMDTDNRFDVPRLVEIMQTMLCHGRSPATGGDETNLSNQIIINALSHVHIFRPQSLQSLVATVQSLPDYLLNFTAQSSYDRSLDLLVIDSIGAFFWQEKSAEEALKFDGENLPSHRWHSSSENLYSQLVNYLRTTQQRFSCAVVATNWGISPTAAHQGALYTSFRSFLPTAWQALVTTRIVVERDAVTKFPAGMSLEQSKRDAPIRQTAVDEGRFTAWIERQDATARGRADVVGLRKVGFSVTRDGVCFGNLATSLT